MMRRSSARARRRPRSRRRWRCSPTSCCARRSRRPEFERIRTRSISDLALTYANPSALARAVAQRVAFGAAPYGHPIAGTAATLRALDRDRVAAFHERFYRPDDATLVIGGDIAIDDAFDLAEDVLGEWRAPAATARRTAARRDSARPRTCRHRRQARCGPHCARRGARDVGAPFAGLLRRDGRRRRAVGLQRTAEPGDPRQARALVRRRRVAVGAPHRRNAVRIDARRPRARRGSGARHARCAALARRRAAERRRPARAQGGGHRRVLPFRRDGRRHRVGARRARRVRRAAARDARIRAAHRSGRSERGARLRRARCSSPTRSSCWPATRRSSRTAWPACTAPCGSSRSRSSISAHRRSADAAWRAAPNATASRAAGSHYGVSSSFPVVLRASRSRCASAAFASGYVAPMRTCSVPACTAPNRSRARPSSSSRVRM